MRPARITLSLLSGLALAAVATAGDVELRVTVENLAPENSVTFAPLQVGFNSGSYDSFNEGQAASAAIISIAENGSGSDWFPAFAAADSTATLGSVLPNPPGPLLPGQSGMADFMVNPMVNPFFTFGAMVVPSNDYFIGNDSPMQHMLFDAGGNLNITSITLTASDIWDAGSEEDGAFRAAFLAGSNAGDHVDENGVVGHDFADLSIFNGMTTAAGYTFQSQLMADMPVYRISFEVVPEPATAALLAIAGLFAIRRRG